MEFLLDTANVDEIAALVDVYPISGVTTNPSLIKAVGRVDLYPHLRRIREVIGARRSLHVQVLAQDADGMFAEAHRIQEQVDAEVFVKVPATQAGLAAMSRLKASGVRITATAVYSKLQGMLAIAAGADYVAAYVNRMESLDIDSEATIRALVDFAERHGGGCQVLGASFANPAQVSAAFEAGAPAVTVAPRILQAAVSSAPITQAVEAFTRDWFDTFATTSLP